MQVSKIHNVSQSEAIKRIDEFLVRLLKRPKIRKQIVESEKIWNDNIMSFSVTVNPGTFIPNVTVTGRIIVIDNRVTLKSNLPGIIATFVSREKIKELINPEFDKLFPESK